MFVKRIKQINECWFRIWKRWFLLSSLIIQFLLHLDTTWGFVSNKCSSPYCEDGIMGMFLEVLANNPILVNIDHLMQFVCFRERNLIYGIHNCSISNIFGDMAQKHFFVTWETLKLSFKMVSSNFLLHENLLWALENKAMDKNETKQKISWNIIWKIRAWWH